MQNLTASASEVAQFANRPGRYEAGPDHGVAQQMSQPPCVRWICLMPFAAFYILRVRQHHGQTILQDVEDRLPVSTRALQHRMRAPLGHQPLPQLLQFGIRCSVGAHLSLGILISRANYKTYGDTLLADINAGTTFDDGVQSYSPKCWRESTSRLRSCSTGLKAPIGSTCTSTGSVFVTGLGSHQYPLRSRSSALPVYEQRGKATFDSPHFHDRGWPVTRP